MAGVYATHTPRRTASPFQLSLTLQIVILNVVFFILVSLLWSFDVLSLDAIAIKPANILSGQYLWTFLTSMFMHAGLFHLFANMLSLVFIGSLVEKILGRTRYFWFYLLSGILATLLFVVSALFVPAEMNVFAVGASGALFALVGLLVLLTPNLPVYLMFVPIPVKMKYAGPGMLVLLWLISLGGNVPIGNTAHLGGLLAGIGYGLYLRKTYTRRTKAISRMFS